MTEKKKLVVWVPLPPNSSWRGEGIAQTIENIVRNISPERKIEIVVSSKHAEMLVGLEKSNPNISVLTLGFRGKSTKKTIGYVSLNEVEKDSLWDLVIAKLPIIPAIFRKVGMYVSQLEYLLSLYIYSHLQRRGRFSSNNCRVWLPTPIIPYTHLLGGEKFVSFWDPFVFEYNKEFPLTAEYFVKKLSKHFSNASAIITQSRANKDYLETVMGIESSKINVIYNGSPDYSEFKKQQSNLSFSEVWSKSEFSGASKKAAFEALVNHQLNFSVLWRLLTKNKVSNRKIVLISTQNRPYKGFDQLFVLINELCLRRDNYDFIFTCNVPTKLKERYPSLYERIHEVTRVDNYLHASLYLMSDIVLHPSNVEGGLGAYPQYEASSVGKPSLINTGRHVNEMAEEGFDVDLLSSNFVNTKETVDKIEKLI
ncbi:TPA: glycosyltransferase family 4 protein, partial [Vibrio cholerae]|nr:glycosyltransferase family 4 protein [Vibrio cholerae]HAV0076346.1 glycosyltransferase family 4 protein [Vibrio cholerae]